MRCWVLAFLCGVLFLQIFAVLPGKYCTFVLFAAALLIEFYLVKKRWYLRYFSACLFGFVWASWYAHSLLSWNLPSEYEGKPVLVSGFVVSVPNEAENGATFLFSLETMQSEHVRAIIKLSLRDNAKKLHAGDQWQWMVKLKRIHGLMNPGGFDYEAWALQEKIRAHGYVVASGQNRLLASHWYRQPLNRMRQRLKEKIEDNLPHSLTSPWIVALALGERQNIAAENWEILRNTGTNHLMAIAGLHIGFMSSFMFFLVSWCWRRVPALALRIPAQFAGGCAALNMALVYSALAGFSIPTQRACIMLSAALATLLMRRVTMSWQAWCAALLAVLLINPLSVLTESFWLSFGSVALIIYGVGGRLNPQGLWWKLGRIQWVIAVGLIPLSIWLFQQFSLISFAANSIAIPAVGFIIVPLTLLGCFILLFSAKCGGLVLLLADKTLSILWSALTYFSHLSWASGYLMVPSMWVLLAACIGMVIILLPAGFPGKLCGVFWFFPLFFYQYPAPKQGEVHFNLLDVGQGLSAVVQTAHHVLVFDAGAKLGGYDMGESVVAPFLRSIGAKKVDMLVISHPDNDHIGGAKTLYHYFHILRAKTSAPEQLLPFSSQYCLRGESWQWDDVNFEFLYPPPENLDFDNDSSCVLRVTSAAHKSILLTGDIEKLAERYLIEHDAKNLRADILVAPHHGSKTSALDDFVADVNPHYVLFPVGYRNRYHFPHKSVVEKYQQQNASLFSTERDGAIQFTLNETVLPPTLYRQQAKHYWNFKEGS